MIIALKEAEHRPMVEARFPEWAARVRYWHVDDIPLVPADRALAQIEPLVRDLVQELAASSPVPNLSRT